jgi:hypothetical protein
MLLVGLVVQAWQQGPMFVIVLENGRQVDALKLKLPGGEPMKSANKARFLKTIEPLKFELDSIAIYKSKVFLI